MHRILSIILASVCFLAGAAAESLEPLLNADNLWSLSGDEFMKAASPLKYRWTSNAKDSARLSATDLTLFGQPVVESVARFSQDKLSDLTIAFYARGDAGELSKEKYDALVRGSAEAISKFTNVRFTPRGKDPKNAVKADGLTWQTDKAFYLLEYSSTREVKTRDISFRAEFVRLEITPPVKAVGLLASATNLQRAKFSGPLHVKRDVVSGDVLIPDVPMVDQGQKGYCVVAATERVMRYYGNQVDANELAQVANTSAERGTSSEAMLDALKKLGARLKIRIRELEQLEVRDLVKLIAEYNRAAKKAGVSPIPDQGQMINVGMVYDAMKPDVLKEVKTRNKADLGRFQREVQMRVDQGVPLLWSVMLGLVPEPHVPQGAGGHMRLIIGYNSKTQEILFTDSWGAGHELKRMPAADAWTITTGITTIEPL